MHRRCGLHWIFCLIYDITWTISYSWMQIVLTFKRWVTTIKNIFYIVGHICGRIVRNIIPSVALVFHQTLSALKINYNGWFRRAHPKEELEQSMFFLQDPIMRTSSQYLVNFIQQEFLEIHFYNTMFRVRNLNSGITINI